MTEHQLPYAEDVNYWKTSKSSSESWIDKALRQIEEVGGEVTHHAFGIQYSRGSIMIIFTLDGDEYRVLYPVLQSKYTGGEPAARRQAATMLYHDIKAKCMLVKIFGARFAFCQYLVLDGQPIGQQIAAGCFKGLPRLLT